MALAPGQISLLLLVLLLLLLLLLLLSFLSIIALLWFASHRMICESAPALVFQMDRQAQEIGVRSSSTIEGS